MYRQGGTENKYNFNAFDTVVALAVTQYLKTQPKAKTILRSIIEPRIIRVDAKKREGIPLLTDVDGEALADLLDKAMTWAKDGQTEVTGSGPLSSNLLEALSEAAEGFNGKAYVQSMDTGFLEFLRDLYRS